MAKIEIPKEGTLDWYSYQGLKKTVEEANAVGGKNFTEIAKRLGKSKTWASTWIRRWGIEHVEPKTKKATEMEAELDKACKTFLKYGVTVPDISGATLPSKTKRAEAVIQTQEPTPGLVFPVPTSVSEDTARHTNDSGIVKSKW